MDAPTDATTPVRPTGQPRLRYIDALRGIAALFVVWLHGVGTFARLSDYTEQSGGWFHTVLEHTDVGHIGVVVFFLISGFVIPFSISPDRPAPIGSFVIRRLLRIYPAYWLSVPLAAVAIFWIWGSAFSAREILINLTLLQDFFGVRSAEGVYWTLLVELVFYALCIVLLLTRSLFDMRRIAVLAALLGSVFIAVLVSSWISKRYITSAAPYWFLNLSVMFCGTLFRYRADSSAGTRDRLVDMLFLTIVLGYIVVLPLAAAIVTGTRYHELLTYSIGFLIFIAGTRVLRIETRVTDWLGTISYSTYLFHSIVILSMDWWLLRQPAGSSWRTQHLGVYMAAAVAATLLVATLVCWLVEKPGIRLGHKLASVWQRRAYRARSVELGA